jgi:hypothetical protein
MKEKTLLLKKATSIALLALMMALLAPLAAKAQTVLYEGFDGTTIPLGWERYEGRLHPYWLDDNPNDPEYGTDALTPTNTGWIFGKPYCTSNYNLNHVYFNIYGTDRYFWLVSPTVAIGNNVQLCFDVFYNRYSSCSQPALSGGEDDRFVVVVTSDGDNRWHIVRQWDNNPEPELASGYVLDDFPVYPTRVCLDLSDYAGQNITLAFYAESRISNTDNMLHIDNVSIEYYSACTAPTYLAASDITANSAVLDWYSDADAWQIMLNGDETNLIDVAEIPYTLSGLTPASEYQVSVRSVCGGTTSEWSDDILTFYTACVPIATLPWIENFDSYTPSSSSTNAPESNYVLGPPCWNYYVMNGNDGTSAQYPQIFISSVSTYAVSDNCLLFKTNDTYPIYAMLPEFTDNISDLQLTFTYRSSNVVKVGYVPSLSGWFDDIESYFVPVQTCGTTSTLTEQQVLFTDAPSGSMMVFKIEHGTSNGSITSLDNIIVDYSNSSTCPVPPTPTIVVGSSGAMPTLGASYAWLTWSFDGSDGVEGWQLCVNGDEDNLIEETDTVYYLNGLTPETEYTVKVRSNCGDDHYSDWSGELTFTTLACPVPPTPRIYYENSEMPLGMTFAELTWWDELIDMESYQLYLNGYEGCEYIDVTGTEYYLEDLTPGTEYTVNIRSNCGDGYYSEWSEDLTFTTLARTFEMNGNWNVADNWNPNGVPTEGENVSLCAQAVIPEGYTANVGEIIIESESEGSLTIANGGQLIHTNEGVSATVEKAINGYSGTRDNYYLISTPVYSQTYYNYLGTYTVTPYNVENMLSNGYDLYDFDFTEENEWINHKQDGFMLEKTHSYLYANSQDVTLRFTGILSHATMDLNCITDYLPYSEGNYAFANWRLFGNPYPCNAYVGLYDVLNETVSYDHYEMNEDGNDFIYSSAALLPMEGAFYIVGAANRYKLVAIAEASNTEGKSVGSSLNLNLRNDGKLIDAARIRFGEGNGMPKLQLNPSHTKVVIPRDGKDYAVAYSETGVGEMPVSFKAEANGTYTLDFSNEEVTFNYLHLIDNLTGNEVDLLQTPTYTFEAKTTDYASRFKLVFAVGSSTGSDTFAFYSNGSYVINNEGRATLQVVDVMGRIIKSETINGCANVNMDAAPGVYMLRLVNGENVKVQKVVVR